MKIRKITWAQMTVVVVWAHRPLLSFVIPLLIVIGSSSSSWAPTPGYYSLSSSSFHPQSTPRAVAREAGVVPSSLSPFPAISFPSPSFHFPSPLFCSPSPITLSSFAISLFFSSLSFHRPHNPPCEQVAHRREAGAIPLSSSVA